MIYFNTREEARRFARNVKAAFRYKVVDVRGKTHKGSWALKKD